MPPIESVSWRSPVASMPIGISRKMGCVLSFMARVLLERPAVPPGPEIQRKSRFRAKSGRVSVQKIALFQALACQIRYAADQPNFARDQRIGAALTTEKQRKVG